MDIRELESVFAVDTYRNYSEAAYNIASSPAVISKHVAKVEAELGIRLFERASKSRPVQLTREGEAVMENLREIIRQYRLVQEKAAALTADSLKSIRVGYVSHIGNFCEPDILAKFSLENPGVSVARKVGSKEELINMLMTGSIDAALTPIMLSKDPNAPRFEDTLDSSLDCFKILSHQSLTIGVNDMHPLAKENVIRKEQFPLLFEDLFLFSYASLLNGGHQRKNFTDLIGFPHEMRVRFIDFTEPTIALRLVESGAGILPQACIVPRRVGNVNFIPVEGWDTTIAQYFVTRKDTVSQPVLRLKKCVQEFAESWKNGVL